MNTSGMTHSADADYVCVRVLFVTVLMVLTSSLLSIEAAAQSKTQLPGHVRVVALNPSVSLPRVTMWAGEDVAKTYVAPKVPLRSVASPFAKSGSTSTFIVTYTGFPTQAQAAFQAAVDVWSQVLVSPVPIRVSAVWEDLGNPFILGSAGPGTWAADSSFYYPIALAEALEETDLNSTSSADIDASFNSARTDWYFGTDGDTPAGQYDLMSVVMHELGHGLGFIGFLVVDDGSGICDGVAGHGCVGYAPLPAIFDNFTEDDVGISFLNDSIYPQDSIALGNALTSGEVFFDGPSAIAANSAVPPELYAPGSWEQGSSYSHLDESIFGPGDPNSLMTPVLWSAEAVHHPGAITLGIFTDMGWEVVTSTFSDGFESGDTNAWSSAAP